MSHGFTVAILSSASAAGSGYIRLENDFFKKSGVVHLCYLESGKNINHVTYIDDCLKPIVKVLKKERPFTGAKNIKSHHDNARPHVHKRNPAVIIIPKPGKTKKFFKWVKFIFKMLLLVRGF